MSQDLLYFLNCSSPSFFLVSALFNPVSPGIFIIVDNFYSVGPGDIFYSKRYAHSAGPVGCLGDKSDVIPRSKTMLFTCS